MCIETYRVRYNIYICYIRRVIYLCRVVRHPTAKHFCAPLDGNIIPGTYMLGIHAADARASAPLANNNVVLPLLYIYIGNIYYTSFYVVFFTRRPSNSRW